ncbi:hypothetical protein PHYBLDRAFT_151585 [Phycomyces blakesleeanus NRRL 1555(-)]|uniref:Uncharacterized protein n=1 Tax=Phycomyces blakesleeanus (strain ATCC 8743b / DSM 1359 / FGSC 10004 / NBRC 33097 / NRRL 1555) TaxID=763407 RepID=A0A162ZK17_PHYB8|nr:hypothetical protein PHYBLDRAFT_151585 [Phycomyces blakesleeanus NRRL 1555(-)]OAD67331.1 hypothetical protein PHYBLDRAFT_151585 [Phycomyces blakesleeanus NRRL 1555(-)]|eukprot:XP_018285371.1 hypothetical protein PHYBLDRAFT_151585 [Phycomyces blakesleeanus NRRL 1555(-)]
MIGPNLHSNNDKLSVRRDPIKTVGPLKDESLILSLRGIFVGNLDIQELRPKNSTEFDVFRSNLPTEFAQRSGVRRCLRDRLAYFIYKRVAIE